MELIFTRQIIHVPQPALMIDTWMQHADLEKKAINSELWNTEYITVFQERNSYIEHYWAYALPIGPRQALESLRSTNWACDINRSKIRIARTTNDEFLSLAFRNFAHLRGGIPRYLDDAGELIAQGHFRDDHVSEKKIRVRRDKVVEFLSSRRKKLLLLFRSHRFSERTLSELGITQMYDTFQGDSYNYVKEYRNIADGQNRDIFARERASTFSFLFGKSLILDPSTE